ncbi:LLM class flavin-dependent oxidoreductase [Planomonospora sp. ID91781]|uniref:LLM class flavin-dependent oxidoreductase n=1 Tax=Planomonospora sp. ID91781 TaxID=2738135 RepID=UPI0018C4091B|nr:LLM class flavin-dependent oxidoreductase [Planomonospora sp. ID91781]MBG0822650.1 LLM class flavin-dependent oxidoreductase [Planomonospora sp. ID91781]
MRFLAIALIAHGPDPVAGRTKPTTERFREVVADAVLAEELGFDGFGVGERHERPFISSSPPVVLSHIAARTSEIRLFAAATTLSLLDPVRAFGGYAELVDHYRERWAHYGHDPADGLTGVQHRGALEPFQAEIALVLRKEIPSRPFPGRTP